MPITETLETNARLYGAETALVEREPARDRRRELTWLEFDRLAHRTANALMRRGIRKGDTVGLLMMNCLEWLPIYFGILRTGALAAPLNFRFDAGTIKRCLHTAEAKALIFGVEFIERVDAIHQEVETVTQFIFVGPDELRPAYADLYAAITADEEFSAAGHSIKPSDDAALYFTSGTTGAPKAALLTHENLAFACRVEQAHHDQTHDDNFLCIPPLYHTGAKMHWFGNFLVGAKAVILKGVSPEFILEAISEERVTIVWLLVPWALDILHAIENRSVNLDEFRLDRWRLMHIGAQPVPRSLVEQWLKVFPHHQYDTNYGLTESTGPGCVRLGVGNIHKVGSIGTAGFGWETKIVNGDLKPAHRGETGELAVKGPGVMKGYYKDPGATEEVLVDGWLLTGDMAREDEDGFIWLVDRKKDVIITGGENIYPVEIEDHLMAHPNVRDAAVIGVPDQRLGEIATAVIAVKSGRRLTEDEVFDYCSVLPRYKQPRKVVFGEVPRNPTGKIEKPKLRKRYGAGSKRFGV